MGGKCFGELACEVIKARRSLLWWRGLVGANVMLTVEAYFERVAGIKG